MKERIIYYKCTKQKDENSQIDSNLNSSYTNNARNNYTSLNETFIHFIWC